MGNCQEIILDGNDRYSFEGYPWRGSYRNNGRYCSQTHFQLKVVHMKENA